MMVDCGDWDWGASDQPDIAMNRKTAPSIPANTFEPLMLRVQLIGMCFLDFFIMVSVDVELLRFLLVGPTWCHSAAKSRWRAQAPSQRSLPATTRLLRCTKAKIRKGHRNFEGIFARWKIAGLLGKRHQSDGWFSRQIPRAVLTMNKWLRCSSGHRALRLCSPPRVSPKAKIGCNKLYS